MTNYEIVLLFAVIVAIYAVPAAICWYITDRKLKQMEQKFWFAIGESLLHSNNMLITRLRNIK
jgi:hypothetical protein